MTDLVERLHDIPADLCWTEDKGAHRNIPAGAIAHEAADEIERLNAETLEMNKVLYERDERITELLDEIERLRAEIERLTAELNKYELAAMQARTAQVKRND